MEICEQYKDRIVKINADQDVDHVVSDAMKEIENYYDQRILRKINRYFYASLKMNFNPIKSRMLFISRATC